MDKLLVNFVEEERTIIRASLTSSHRLSNDIHQLWIVFKSDRSVITGFCFVPILLGTVIAATILTQCYVSSTMQMKKSIQIQLVQTKYVIGIHHQRKFIE